MTNDLQIDQKKWLVATKKVTKWTTDWQKKVTSELQIDKWLMNLQIDKKMWLVTTIWQMTKIDTWTTDWPVTTNWQMTKKKMTSGYKLTIWQKKWLNELQIDKKSD